MVHPISPRYFIPKVPENENKKVFRRSGNDQQDIQSFFMKDEFFPNRNNISFEIKREPFLHVVEIIQANQEEISPAVEQFLISFFCLEDTDLPTIKNLVQHKNPFLDYLFGKFYTKSIKEFLLTLGYKKEEIQMGKWGIKTNTRALLINILQELVRKGLLQARSLSLKGLDLQEIDLTNSLLEKVHLEGANLIGARFRDADLRGGFLNNTNLTNADFTGAQIDELNLNGATVSFQSLLGLNLHSVYLEGTKIIRSFPNTFGPTDRKIYFSPEVQWNALRTIHSISAPYNNLKIKMMQRLIEKFNECSPQTRDEIIKNKNSFREVLLQNKLYLSNPIILKFIQTYLIPPVIELANSGGYEFSDTEIKSLYQSFIEPHILNSSSDWFYSYYSGFINQFIFSTARVRGSELAQYGEALKKMYIDSLPDRLTTVDGLDMQALINHEEHMLFISPDENHAMYLPQAYYQRNVLNDSGFPHIGWSSFAYIKKSPEGEYEFIRGANIETVIEQVPFFKKAYNEYRMSFNTGKFLSRLNLGPTLLTHFNNTLNQRSYTGYKLVTNERQTELAEIFNPWIDRTQRQEQNNYQLTPITNYLIAEVFNFDIDTSNASKQGIYLCLAAFFTRLSAERFFGTSDNSPQILRTFALACLNSSLQFQPPPLPSINLNDWKMSLARDSCSDTLSNAIIRVLRETHPNELRQVVPAVWQ